MRLPISKLLTFFCFSVALNTAQGQSCKEVIKEKLEAEIAEQVAYSLASLKSLESVEAIAAAATCEGLATLEDLTLPVLPTGEMLLENMLVQPDPRVVDVQGAAYAHTKVKKIDRTFKVSRADKLNIENQFGQVNVQTWNRNEIAVEVTVISRAVTEEKAQEILDKIQIRINEDRANNLLSFVTEREPMQIRSSSEKAFEINYLVKMPKGNPIRVSNKYGSVQMPDFDGPTELEVNYGKLTTGSLNNVHNRLNVTYSGSPCQIAYMKGGTLRFKYSNLHLMGADDIKTTTAYSNIVIDKVDMLAMDSRYDSKYLIGSAGQISGTGSYSGIKIGSLRESASLIVKYCSGFEINNVSSNFRKLDLNGGYTGMAVSFADNTAFNFEVDTQYGSFKLDQDLVNFSFKEVGNTSSSYKGKYGKASPKGTVNVTSKYGSIAFR
ncbi:hypothetical protein [Rufibacter tibetensis]|uniref:hypothetical protein n=1 Tax=Rufibacter tibetensis TaxID=512763 RepID=UPI000783492C|nr:hypothetical protein [Rufibacter tibetensis]